MKIAVTQLVLLRHCPVGGTILLCLLFSLLLSACGPPATTEVPATVVVPVTAPSVVPEPIIEPGGPCEVAVDKTLPLAVKGVAGSNVVYRWTATAGNVNPPNGTAVIYNAPNTPQDVIIRVEAEKDGITSVATLTCKVTGPTQTPENTATPAPTLTPVPSPTSWVCTSYRSQKLGSADIPGEVTISTPSQGATDIPSRQDVQVSGSYRGIPEGMYLWVFLYSADAGLHGRYYPQTRDAVQGWQPEPTTGNDGAWTVKVNFGAGNLCYEIIVAVADAETSQSIAEQLQRWAAAEDYTGYELNGPASAEPPDPPGFPDGLVEKASIEVRTK